MVYFGLSLDDDTKLSHIVLIHSYDEYTPNDFLSTEDYTVLYTTTTNFRLANMLADLDLEEGKDFVFKNKRKAIEFLFSKKI